ncbi:hypothetical protein R5R35_006310 [Gryllus longicercus]|uniref:MRG domain-containing protein n=1 Tax=Gryllus longicercus TaxID=2509291 RepID=A0AAN9VDV1_9ORTH
MPRPKFSVGEKVLCSHNTMLYNAICLATVVKIDGNLYLIHYQVKQPEIPDEWVHESRILEYNEANIKKQKELQTLRTKSNRQKRRKSLQESTPGFQNTSNMRRRKTQSFGSPCSFEHGYRLRGSGDVEKLERVAFKVENPFPHVYNEGYCFEENNFVCRIKAKVTIPPELRPVLLDDWDRICRQKHLVILPSKPNVSEILENYLQHESSSSNIDGLEFVRIIEKYFNALLGSRLLYKFERLQYADILKTHPDLPMSKIYGAIHLLRSFVKIESVLQTLPLDRENEHDAEHLLRHVHGIMNFIGRENVLHFCEYDASPPEYRRQFVGAD